PERGARLIPRRHEPEDDGRRQGHEDGASQPRGEREADHLRNQRGHGRKVSGRIDGDPRTGRDTSIRLSFPIPNRRFLFLLAPIVALAAAVRLFRLDAFSYGLDEILQGYWIQGSWAFFWKSLRFDAVHPPLDYLLARGVETLGPADWARKLPDVLWGCLTVAALAWLVSRRAGARAGLLAAFLLALAPFHVRYSQEFRPYSLGLLLVCVSLLCLDRYLEAPRAGRLLLLYASCLATAYSLYLSAVVLGVASLGMLAEDALGEEPLRRRSARRFLLESPIFAAALFAGYLPWWPVVREAAHRPPVAAAAPLTLDRTGSVLSFFLFAPEGGRPLGIAGLFYLAIVALGAAACLRRHRSRFLVAWAVGGFAAIEILGQLHPHYDFARRYLPAGLVLPAVAAVGIAWIAGHRRLRWIAAAGVFAVLALDARSLGEYFTNGRADWRFLARAIAKCPASEPVFTENQYAQLCTAFYAVGPLWLSDGGNAGRQIPNLDGEIVRLTWSWTPGTTAWLVLAGEPVHPELRAWAASFPSEKFPASEGAILVRLDSALRDRALAGR
ncbi:MAG: glycosyltransferase family 39 protein, partial [Thermoanaerobaculia bacterium]